MSIEPRVVFQDGIDAFLSRKALVLGALFVVVGSLASVAVDSLGLALAESVLAAARQQGTVPADVQAEFDRLREQLAWAADVSVADAVWVFVASVVAGEATRIGAIRAFADDDADDLSVEHFARRFLPVFANRVVVAVLTALVLAATAIPTLFLPSLVSEFLALVGLVPFCYVLVGVYFASYAVTLDEDGPVEAFTRSWSLAAGNRTPLVLVAVGVLAVTLAFSLPTVVALPLPTGTGSLAAAVAERPGGFAVAALAGAVAAVFRIAIATHAYRHLVERTGPTFDDRPDPTTRTDPDDAP
ncbi:hypothetical protein [Halorubellus sp. PRR65]|uniref:hypothetical protein n=1 Tax=Halorubellus sp. PRR65 TaxID=3098148 RepID=UPI002B25F9A2|nr:hypothetical protein [Halorubellus sp. PRR65]